MDDTSEKRELYEILKSPHRNFDKSHIKNLFSCVKESRVIELSVRLKDDLSINLPKQYSRRSALSDYRTNPYVLLATANIMGLSDPNKFADFLFNSKLTMGLETSFGKLIERAFVQGYPVGSKLKWRDPPEKLAEFDEEKKAEGRAAKAALRSNSIWREIDKDVVFGNRRYMTSIKSGPNTINDTQVQGMADAIATKHVDWLKQSRSSHPNIDGIDIVIGLTYGTERTTNNKDNQILAKLLNRGFSELNQEQYPGILVDDKTKSVRVYRRIGQEFWSWIGCPADSGKHPHIFLEILLALTIAFRDILSDGSSIEEGINARIQTLSKALLKMTLSEETLPDWISSRGLSEEEIFYLVTALSAFYDDGI